MDMDLEPKTILITLMMYGFCMVVLWKLMIKPFGMFIRILLSIIMLPLSYLATTIGLERGGQ